MTIRNPQMFTIHARHVMDLARTVRERRRRGIPTRTFWVRWVMYSAYATARSIPPRRIPRETVGTFTVQSSAAAALSIWMTNLTYPKEWADQETITPAKYVPMFNNCTINGRLPNRDYVPVEGSTIILSEHNKITP
jgi:hypothetical protein